MLRLEKTFCSLINLPGVKELAVPARGELPARGVVQPAEVLRAVLRMEACPLKRPADSIGARNELLREAFRARRGVNSP